MAEPRPAPAARSPAAWLPIFFLAACALLPLRARGEPLEFDLPAQPAADALLAFSAAAKVEVLFSADELRSVRTAAVTGRYEPADALVHLLAGTGFTARRTARGTYLITRLAPLPGTLRGRIVLPDGTAARAVQISLAPSHRRGVTDAHGEFQLERVPPGLYHLTASANGFQTLRVEDVRVDPDAVHTLETQTIHPTEEITKLDPYVVTGESTPLRALDRSRGPPPRTSTGNIDLPRTRNDALPFSVYDRDEIVRSGVINLNEFFQREVLDGDASARPPEQDGGIASFRAGSPNLSLRGFGGDQTVVLVNGRRLPEVLTDITQEQRTLGPDVSFIPLSMVQQIQVLPVSASALYSGNAVGGVINIILRPATEVTEVTTTYTNALAGFDAPQSSVSLLHGQTLLDGRLHLRLNATWSALVPPTEAELRYRQSRPAAAVALDAPLFRATPNVRSADGSALFGPGTATVTSVAPGADGAGGLAAFNGRQGERNFGLFDPPGGTAASLNALQYPYGRRQQRTSFYGSATYDLFPTLQLGLDGSWSRTVVHRGFEVFTADLDLAANSPLNPFGQEVRVALNDTAPKLGRDYNEARLESFSIVGGLLLKLPRDWQVSLDSQYARNLAKYRGLFGADAGRWQQLVDSGAYNPLRDTQVSGPPPAFYDRVLVHYGGLDHFVTLGDYDTVDAAMRIINSSLALPTGRGTAAFGADYRVSRLAPYHEIFRYADGSLAQDPVEWSGRTLQRYSFFGELQGAVVPTRHLPRWLTALDADLAVRYVAADSSRETNVAPTLAFKAGFPGGIFLRGSLTTSNRFPTPQMSRPISTPSGGNSGGVDLEPITDPRRNESYDVRAANAVEADLHSEAALTQTAGLVFERGDAHRVRLSLDFADTHKTNELGSLGAQSIVDLEQFLPLRVVRDAKSPGDSHSVGRIASVLTGSVNLATRHSQNWNASLDYTWRDCLHGTLECYARFVYFQRYDLRLLPGSPLVDELGAPDGAAPGLLRDRANFGAGWSNRDWGLGFDGHYFHSRNLPPTEWAAQGGPEIRPYWQFDAYLQADLTRWLPRRPPVRDGRPGFGLRAQLRVNNLSGFNFPKYVNEATGSGVQPYDDWRGRTYSLSLTATF